MHVVLHHRGIYDKIQVACYLSYHHMQKLVCSCCIAVSVLLMSAVSQIACAAIDHKPAKEQAQNLALIKRHAHHIECLKVAWQSQIM